MAWVRDDVSVSLVALETFRLPVESQTQIAMINIESTVASTANRGPASVSNPAPQESPTADDVPFFLKDNVKLFRILNDEEREHWSRWARKRLDYIQELMDSLDTYTELREPRRELVKIANEIVNFHGYAEKGDAGQLLNHLGNIDRELKNIEMRICSGPPSEHGR